MVGKAVACHCNCNKQIKILAFLPGSSLREALLQIENRITKHSFVCGVNGFRIKVHYHCVHIKASMKWTYISNRKKPLSAFVIIHFID